MSVVLDASLIVALLVADDHQQAVQEHMRIWIESGEELHAPQVLPYEVANVLARRVYDGDLSVSEIAGIWSDLADLDVTFHPFDMVRDGAAVAEITHRLRRRHAADATYVQLAVRLHTFLWTLDGALARGTADIGLPVRLIS